MYSVPTIATKVSLSWQYKSRSSSLCYIHFALFLIRFSWTLFCGRSQYQRPCFSPIQTTAINFFNIEYNYCVSGHLSIVLFLFNTHKVSGTGFCLRLQVGHSQLGSIDRASSISPDLKHNVSETAFCLRLQVGPSQLGQIDRSGLCLRTSAETQDRIYMYV
jgi:hypothetical protein